MERKENTRSWYVCLILMAESLCWFLVLTGCGKEEPSDMAKEIMAVANSEASDLGYDLSTMTVKYDIGNKEWENYVQSESTGNSGNTAGELGSVIEHLKKHNFQGVYYAPKGKLILGGDVWVFIDTDTKEVITTIHWK